MNALGFVQQGLQAREQALHGQAQEGYRNALSQFGTNAPQTRTAFAAVNPVAANALQSRDQERRDAMIGKVAQTLAGMPPEVQAQAYPQFAQQLAQSGIDLGQFAEYPGPDAIAVAARLYGMPPAERSEFERLISALPPEEQGQALRMRLGLEPDANMRLRVGAQQSERDPIAALRARAAEADLRPGTPEYTQFMIQGGAGSGFAVDVDPATGAVSVRQGAGAGQAQRPLTEGQSKDVVYATRAEGALAVLEPIAGALASFGDRALDMDPTGAVRGQFQSEQYQVAKNAGDEFLQAILRKDTGAAITSQEQELYGATYLPRPGDGPAVLEQKAQARRRAISALQAGMSPAQMLAVERGLAEGGASPSAPGVTAPPSGEVPPGVDPEDWEFMSPEDRALFGGSGAANPTDAPAELPGAAESVIRGSFERGAPVAPITLARAFVGKEEGRDADALSNFFEKVGGVRIDPRVTAWCAAFANTVLQARGLEGTGRLNARSFLDWGTPVDQPSEGDVVVLWRESPDSRKGHVGFYAGMTEDGKVRVVGGNQNNRVSETAYPADRVLGYRRPPRLGSDA